MKLKVQLMRALALSVLLSGMFVLTQTFQKGESTVSAYPPPGTPPPTPHLPQITHQVFLPLMLKGPTTSRYIKPDVNLPPNLDANKFYNMGYYSYTSQSGVVIFSFGQPCSSTSGGVTTYGATAYRTGCRGIPEIKTAVQEFIRGYCDSNGCSTYSPVPRLTLAIGTTNCSNGGSQCANPGQSTNVTYAHGQAWSQLIGDLISYTTSHGYSYQVFVVGADDIEFAWNTDTNTRAWVDGYKQGNYRHLYNFGTCDGCPTNYTPNPVLPNGWSYDDAWYVSYGASVTFYPLPEIYRTDGTHAEQWQAVSYYAATVKSGKIIFKGVLTTYQACVDTDFSSCESSGITNTSQQAWTQLWNTLYQDPLTRVTTLPWQTDITWQQP